MYLNTELSDDISLQIAKSYKPYIKSDYRSCKAAYESEDYNKVIEECQQIMEKCLKGTAYIIKINGRPSKTQLRNHDLKNLKIYCSPHFNFLTKDDIKIINYAYTASRYPEYKKIYSKDEAKKFLKLAKQAKRVYFNALESYKFNKKNNKVSFEMLPDFTDDELDFDTDFFVM